MAKDKTESLSSYTVYDRPGMAWINVTSPSADILAEIKLRFPFLMDLDLRDCLPPYQRPKMIARQGYIFLVLLFPIYHENTRRIKVREIDIFIGPNFLITSHTGELKAIRDMAGCFEDNVPSCPPEYVKAPVDLLHAILDTLLKDCFPMLTHVANDIQELERRLFSSDQEESEAVRDTLRIKTNVVDFRQAMQGHKRVIEKFMVAAPQVLKLDGMKVLYEDLINHAKEIWDFLDNDQKTIDTVFESYTSIINYETSQATKALSAIALIIFPTALVAAVFAMDSEHMPIRGYSGDWWIMLGLVTTTATVVIYFLKKKRWL
ncbi:magnesium transporter CorA family protein [Candidatus Uhrbacteria bacterium]|nr:magnesium transporter CorA family protein [Candidatus Uhrbacteria bacterium]